MKRLSTIIVAVFMAMLMAVQVPLQAFAAANDVDYISEIKVFMAKEEKDAKAALQNEGYTLLDCNLNQAAEGGWGSKGKKATYLGYKTTKDSAKAITDLAVMNMKGGYKTQDYDSMMNQYIHGEIEPFLDGFINAIKEYRENYSSDIKANQTRAQVIHDLLNKYKDDDTGKYIGDLLLNETKYEIGDDAYNALSDEEKKNCADLVTIFAQSNGQATLVIENLITRASDTSDDTWIDRFSVTTYDDLAEETGETPTDAKKELAKLYDDDANTILDDLWDDFKEAMEGYDDAVEATENYDDSSYNDAVEAYNNMDENASDEEKESIIATFFEELEKYYAYLGNLETISVYEMLDEIDYEDGTLLDFFMQDKEDIEDDITVLYPIIASLTDGQRSGLDFVSLKELCCMAITNEDGYGNTTVDSIPESSVYDGVDREIYDKGGVGLTSDAIRTDALNKAENNSQSKLGAASIALWSITASLAVACIASGARSIVLSKSANALTDKIYSAMMEASEAGTTAGEVYTNAIAKWKDATTKQNALMSSSTICKYLSVGLAVVTIVLAIVSIWQTYKDLKNYYKVEFTPQPRFIVEETDITGYNKKGEKIVLKNQSAYYKIVETNRDSGAEYYKTLGTGNDINGDVGQQWLTLYAVKMEGKDPILANSLTTVTKSTEIPSGYKTGIHMFGEDTAYNLNNTKFVWDDDAPSIFVYYKTDDSVSTTGTFLTTGYLALTGGLCLIFGAGIAMLCMTAVGKRKEKKNAFTQSGK